MEINPKEYLSKEEIKEICKEEIRDKVREHFENDGDVTRIMSNVAYHIVLNEADKTVGDSRELIRENTEKIIKDKDAYRLVFQDGSHSFEKKSLAYTYIEDEVKDQKDYIKDRVSKALVEADYDSMALNKVEGEAEEFMGRLYDLIEKVRDKKKEGNE